MEIAYYNFNLESWYFPAGPVAKTMLPMQGTQVQFLVRELRSHMMQWSQINQSILFKIKLDGILEKHVIQSSHFIKRETNLELKWHNIVTRSQKRRQVSWFCGQYSFHNITWLSLNKPVTLLSSRCFELTNPWATAKCALQGSHLPLIPRSTFIKRLSIESRLSPCLISTLVEKWPLNGWGFSRETNTPG